MGFGKIRDVTKIRVPVRGLRQVEPAPMHGSISCGVSSLLSEVGRKVKRRSIPPQL